MPDKAKTFKKWKRKQLGTRPQFMSKYDKFKRKNNILDTTRWFTSNGEIESLGNGNSLTRFAPFIVLNGKFVPNLLDTKDFNPFSTFWSQYKVLAIKVTMFAANVGTEPIKGGSGTQAVGQVYGFNRGNTVMYTMNQYNLGQILPDNIQDVISRGSARMIPSRTERWTTMLYRPKGYPRWGCCDTRVVGWQNREYDSWHGMILQVGENATGSNTTPGGVKKKLWYWVLRFKIKFRGRKYSNIIVPQIQGLPDGEEPQEEKKVEDVKELE